MTDLAHVPSEQPSSGPAGGWHRLRRVGRVLLSMVLLLGILWVLRSRLLAPLCIAAAEAFMEERFEVSVEIEALEGSYFGDLSLRGVELQRADGVSFPVRRLVGGELTLRYSLVDLLRHGAGGLRELSLSGEELALDLSGPRPGGDEDELEALELELPRVLPQASVSFTRLGIELASGRSLELERLEGRIEATADQAVELDVRQARLRDGEGEPLEGPLELRGAWHGGRPRLSWLRGLGLSVEEFGLDLEAQEMFAQRVAYQPEEGSIELCGVRLPLGTWDPARLSEELRGELSVELAQIPPLVRELPEGFAGVVIETFEKDRLQLELHGAVANGHLELSRGRLSTRSGRVELRRGSFDWQGVDFERGTLELSMDVDFPDLEELEGLLAPAVRELRGSLRGFMDLRGPPLALVGEVELQGEALYWNGRPLGELESQLSLDGGVIGVRRLRAALDGENFIELQGSLVVQERRVSGLEIRGRLSRLDALMLPGITGGGMALDAQLEGPLDGLVGSMELELLDLVLPQRALREIRLRADLAWPRLEVRELRFNDPLGFIVLDGQATWDAQLQGLEARLESLRAVREGAELKSASPATLRIDSEGLARAELELEGSAGRAGLSYSRASESESLQLELEGFDPLPIAGALLPGNWELGQLDGLLELRESAGNWSAEAELSWRGLVPPGDSTEGWVIELRGGLHERFASLRTLEARHPEFGKLLGAGAFPLAPLEEDLLPEGDLELRIALEEFRLAHMARRLSRGALEMEGPLSGRVLLGGTWSQPEGRIELEHGGVYLLEGADDERLGPARLKLEGVLADQVTASVDFELPGHFRLGSEARVAAQPDLRALAEGGGAEWLEAPLEGRIRASSQAVEELTYRYEELPRLRGRAELDIELAGTLREPDWEGRARLVEGVLNLGAEGVPPLAELRLELHGTPAGIEIVEARAEMGGAELGVSGGVRLGELPELALRIEGEEVLLHRADGVRLRADIELAVEGALGALEASGQVALGDGRFVRPFDPLSVLERDSGRLASEGGVSFRIADQGLLATTRLDIGVRAKEAFVLKNNLVRGALRPELRVLGTGRFPELRGQIYLDPTRVFLPGGRLEIRSGTIQFRRNQPTLPHLEISGEAFVQGYHIDLQMSGPLGDTELYLSSVPPLANEDILVLLVTGQLPKNTTGSEAVQTVAVYLATDFVTRWLSGESIEDEESFFERFDYWSGVDPIRAGVETYHVSFRLSSDAQGRLVHSLVGEQDAYEKINLGYRLLFRLK